VTPGESDRSVPVPARLADALVGTPFEGRVWWFARVESTNDELKRRAAGGAAEGTVLIADAQTAGRGRRGRYWHSPPGLGLYVSVLFRSDGSTGPPTRWTLAAAVAACDACHRVGATEVRIEWPNDLVHGPRKLGGILTEVRGGLEGANEIVIGAGINVAHRVEDLPPELVNTATSLRLAGRSTMVERETLAAAYLLELGAMAHRLRSGGWEDVARRWEELAPGCRGRRVRVTSGNDDEPGARRGVTAGIDGDGALIVRGEDGRSFAVRTADAVMPVEE